MKAALKFYVESDHTIPGQNIEYIDCLRGLFTLFFFKVQCTYSTVTVASVHNVLVNFKACKSKVT